MQIKNAKRKHNQSIFQPLDLIPGNSNERSPYSAEIHISYVVSLTFRDDISLLDILTKQSWDIYIYIIFVIISPHARQ